MDYLYSLIRANKYFTMSTYVRQGSMTSYQLWENVEEIIMIVIASFTRILLTTQPAFNEIVTS